MGAYTSMVCEQYPPGLEENNGLLKKHSFGRCKSSRLWEQSLYLYPCPYNVATTLYY
ncbi:hypothetical protein EMPG_10026 [Blastomyces silverae]|uniref:Uncharacterized protein n=1 Tax=Blastomyces silverae TaxID=2060906 RepID=A0A0H1B728_9EURO|nr:hypothetical protein EMPG_10026 [Blastomyces silverae]